MPDSEPAPYNLDALLAEILEDEKVDRATRRLLSQEDIRKLVEESRRRREAERKAPLS